MKVGGGTEGRKQTAMCQTATVGGASTPSQLYPTPANRLSPTLSKVETRTEAHYR